MYLNAADQRFHFVSWAAAESSFDDGLTCCGHHNNHGGVNNCARRQNGQNNKPEPQEDVDFLVENVQSEDAKRIVLLYTPRRSVFVKNTLGDAWKDLNHGIASILLVHVGETQHVRAIGQKCSAQEFVDEENVGNNIGQI